MHLLGLMPKSSASCRTLVLTMGNDTIPVLLGQLRSHRDPERLVRRIVNGHTSAS
jgi:hypothetical protein